MLWVSVAREESLHPSAQVLDAGSVTAERVVRGYLRKALACALCTCDLHQSSCLKPLTSLRTRLFSLCVTKIKPFPPNRNAVACSARCFHPSTMGNRWPCRRCHPEAHYWIIRRSLTFPRSLGVWGARGSDFYTDNMT